MRTIKLALLGFLGAVTLGSSAFAASLTRTSSFEYDPATGLLTKEIVEPDNAQLRVDTTYTYDSYGNKLTATVSSPATGSAAIVSRGSSVGFDSQGRFPLTATNALSHSETKTYDARFGHVASITGPNALTTQMQFDAMGRQILEIRADGTRTRTEYLYCSGVNGGSASCTAPAKYLIRVTPLAADGTTQIGPQGIVFFDGLGREILKQSQGFDNQTINVAKTYDTLGRVTAQSRPYFTGATVKWISMEYDVLGRVTEEIEPDASFTTTAYSGLVLTVTNSKSQTRTQTKNSQGKVIQVKDHLNGTTSYVYDPFENLTQTTDAAGNISAMTYDLRGRKTAMADPNMGSWSYVYNVIGELVSQTDAKSQTVTMTYDKLGRMLSRVEPDGTGAWVYDTATKGIGKLATATTSGGYSRSHTYDLLGRPSQTTQTVDGHTHSSGVTYDAHGRVDVVTYPSGFAIRNVYTARSYLSEVRNNATNHTYWQAVSLDADLQLTAFNQGNLIATTRTYDPNRGRLSTIQATSLSGTIQNAAYTYDTLGSLLTRTDNVNSVVEEFGYDGLNRLTSAQIVDGPAAKTVAYDAVGNITNKSDVGIYSYPSAGSARPNAVSSITGTLNASYTYDANGNLLSGAGRTATWTSFNMPATLTRGVETLTYTYDSEHNRIKQASSSLTTLFFRDGATNVEKTIGSGGAVTWNNYIYVGGKIVTVYYERPTGTSQTRYFHHDHLGSTAVITDETVAIVETLAYDAWGKRRHANGADDPAETIVSSTDRGFTGHAHLQEVGLVHMNGRIYDPTIGRFLSADPNVQDPFSTQSLNRYTYVINNPLAYTDPSGFFFKKLFKTIGKALMPMWSKQFQSVLRESQFVQIAFQAIAAIIGGPIGAALASGYITYVNGGDLGDILKSAAITFATAAAFNVAGSIVSTISDQVLMHAVKATLHAGIGCASSAASGGSCKAGAFAAAASAVVAPTVYTKLYQAGGYGLAVAGGTAVSAVVGGTASVIGGGKFGNGAITGAYGYLFNQLTAAAALEHYKGGTGAPLRMNVNELDLSGISPEEFSKFQEALAVGADTLIDTRNTQSFSMSRSSLDHGLFLGNVTVRMQGQLTFSDEKWNFEGTYKVYDDLYDFNASSHRGIVGEALTTFGRNIPGKPFWIEIRGAIPVRASGSRQNASPVIIAP